MTEAPGAGATAVLDVGKTNVKVAVFAADGSLLQDISRPNRPLAGPPYLHADVAGIWTFLLAALADLGRRHPIRAIVPTTHGATGALIGDDPDRNQGLVLPVMDYEDPVVEAIEPRYAVIRPAFECSFSPPMGGGLNLGRQIAWQLDRFPEAFASATAYVAYPQYWSWRLTGQASSEVTSLGCHTDLWEPAAGRFSSLVADLGIGRLMPALAPCHADAGRIRPEIAARTGLSPEVRVLSGIHDSNASLVPNLLARPSPFTLVSTGTWVVVMGIGAGLDRLDREADMLANVAADGTPVACAKFMGGREYALLAGDDVAGSLADVAELVASDTMALPTFSGEGGPYAGLRGEISGDVAARPGVRSALAGLYAALMTDDLLRRLGNGATPVVIEGGFVKSPVFAAVLAALDPVRPVEVAETSAGTALGAAMLAHWPRPVTLHDRRVAPAEIRGLAAYADRWRHRVAERADRRV